MSKIVYFGLPTHGHVNPTVVLMHELRKRGHHVTYYSSEAFEAKIKTARLGFRSYKAHWLPSADHIGKFALAVVRFAESEVPAHLTVLQKDKPDLIIHDSFAVWGKLMAQSLQVPAVSVFTTLMLPLPVIVRYPKESIPMFADVVKDSKFFLEGIRRYKHLARQCGVKPDRFGEFVLGKEGLNVVLTSQQFQPFADRFDKSFHFAGPLLSVMPKSTEKPAFLKKLDTKKKIIYISLGTLWGAKPKLFQAFINAFADTPYQVIISLGDNLETSTLSNKMPANIILEKYVPQLSVLEKTDVFISHAGMNSVSEGLYYGVPMVLFPQVFEQKINAARLNQLGAGIYFREQITKESLLHAVNRVLNDESFGKQARVIQKQLHASGGTPKAADLVEAYLG